LPTTGGQGGAPASRLAQTGQAHAIPPPLAAAAAAGAGLIALLTAAYVKRRDIFSRFIR
jgi:hypothetical protein